MPKNRCSKAILFQMLARDTFGPLSRTRQYVAQLHLLMKWLSPSIALRSCRPPLRRPLRCTSQARPLLLVLKHLQYQLARFPVQETPRCAPGHSLIDLKVASRHLASFTMACTLRLAPGLAPRPTRTRPLPLIIVVVAVPATTTSRPVHPRALRPRPRPCLWR